MDSKLPNGPVKVGMILPNDKFREELDERKKARLEKLKKENPKLAEKYEARLRARAEQEAQEEAIKEERLNERIRKKIIAETYKGLGIDENYVKQRQAMIDSLKKGNKYANDKGALGRLQAQEEALIGTNNNIAANKRALRKLGLDALEKSGGALASLIGVEVIATAVVGEAAAASFLATVGAIVANPIFGALVAVGAIAKLVKDGMKILKSSKANLVDQAKRIEEYQKELNNYAKQLANAEAQIESQQEMLVAKYKSMKKADFNKFLKKYIKNVLIQHGLVVEGSTQESEQKLAEQIETSAGGVTEIQPSQDQPEVEQANEEKSESKPEDSLEEKIDSDPEEKVEEGSKIEMVSLADIEKLRESDPELKENRLENYDKGRDSQRELDELERQQLENEISQKDGM